MAEPRLLQVGKEETTAKEKGESGLSSAQVGTEAKTVEKASEEPKGVYVANENVVNDNSKALRTSQEAPKGRYVAPTERLGGFERSAGEKGVVNTITVDEVKALIKQYGGGSGDTYTKEEIDQIVETIREGIYVKVDTTVYPTLEEFLASTGEQGTVYLYPIDDENHYEQYIWEVDTWISLGSTEIDLSDYYKKSEDIVPPTDNSKDIGSATKRIKDIYLAGKIKDGTNEVSVAQLSGVCGSYSTNNTTQLEYNYINEISIDADTTFTLTTAPANTYPEYKANITNTDTANAITITLPSGTIIKAESGITVSSNTFTVPANTTVIVSIQDNLALVMIKG